MYPRFDRMLQGDKPMIGRLSAFCATVALATGAQAQDRLRSDGPEVAVGVLDHGVRWLNRISDEAPFSEGLEERHTADVQLVYRSRPLRGALKPRLTAKLQLNTGGRTSFASVGAEWRQHLLRDRVYGQIGIGLTVYDGYVSPINPFVYPIGSDAFRRSYAIYATRTSFGSPVLLNPNISAGVRLDRRWAIEATWEHFSHNQWFATQNPGIDTVGVRLVRTLGRRRQPKG
jgi:lipid A 3-O-deacylase